MPLKKQRTPQEKKRLSLEKDRRYCYGENNKSSRKAVPKRKKKANRAARRQNGLNLELEDISGTAFKKSLVTRWRKVPHAKLSHHLESQRQRRSSLNQQENDA